MCVIPFIFNGDKKTITQDNKDFRTDGSMVLILNADKEQINAFKNGEASNITYDLRIGDRYRDLSRYNSDFLENRSIKVKPKAFLEIETEEELRFPQKLSGAIASKVSILKNGLGVFPTNVDPGYSGRLVIYVYNFSNETIFLNKNQKFCALKLAAVEGEANIYNKPSKSVTGKEKLGLKRHLKWINNNSTTISIVINVLMFIATAFMVYFTFLQVM